MDPSFWRQRWQEGRIGFHEGRPNAFLQRHLAHLANCRRVFVPMCGKTDDLAFLASKGHLVVGVELVEDAVRAFFAEHEIEPTRTERGALVEYTSGSITLFAGNVFDALPDVIGPIEGIYDRAALVALPREMRVRYAQHLRGLGAQRLLLVAYEYDQERMNGPPFSVEEFEVRLHYFGCTIEQLESAPDTRIRENAPPAIERCYAITL